MGRREERERVVGRIRVAVKEINWMFGPQSRERGDKDGKEMRNAEGGVFGMMDLR